MAMIKGERNLRVSATARMSICLMPALLLPACGGLEDENLTNLSPEVAKGVNVAPVPGDDFARTFVDTPVTFNVLDNDRDPDGQEVSVRSVGSPTGGGAVTNNGSGSLTYTPKAGFVGSDSFIYTVGDGVASSSATVRVVVGKQTTTNPANAQNVLLYRTQPGIIRTDSTVQTSSASAPALPRARHGTPADRTLVVWRDRGANLYGRIIGDDGWLPTDQSQDITICNGCARGEPVVAYGGHTDVSDYSFALHQRVGNYIGQWIVVWRNTTNSLSFARIDREGTLLDAPGGQLLPDSAGAIEYKVAAGRHSSMVVYRHLGNIYARPVPLVTEDVLLAISPHSYATPQLEPQKIAVAVGAHVKRMPNVAAANLGSRYLIPGLEYSNFSRQDDAYLFVWLDYRAGRKIYGRELNVVLRDGVNSNASMAVSPLESDFAISEDGHAVDFPSAAGGYRSFYVAWKDYTDRSALGRRFVKTFGEPLVDANPPVDVLFANWNYKEPVAIGATASRQDYFFAVRRSFGTIALTGTHLGGEFTVASEGATYLPHIAFISNVGYVFWNRYKTDVYFNSFTRP